MVGPYRCIDAAMSQRPAIIPKHMFVLGIDPGLTTTGYGVVSSDGPSMVSVGVIRTHKDAPLGERLAELHRDLTAVIAEHTLDAVAIERVFVNHNLQTAMAVARASGVALLAAAQAGLEVVEFTPTTVKNSVTGYGSAPKEQVQKMVARRLRLPGIPQPADAADALAVALCYLQSSRLRAAR